MIEDLIRIMMAKCGGQFTTDPSLRVPTDSVSFYIHTDEFVTIYVININRPGKALVIMTLGIRDLVDFINGNPYEGFTIYRPRW